MEMRLEGDGVKKARRPLKKPVLLKEETTVVRSKRLEMG